MSYIKTKLSLEDKDILQYIYDELEEINIPTTYSRKGVQGHHRYRLTRRRSPPRAAWQCKRLCDRYYLP